jgi:hypothetical protein
VALLVRWIPPGGHEPRLDLLERLLEPGDLRGVEDRERKGNAIALVLLAPFDVETTSHLHGTPFPPAEGYRRRSFEP